MRNLPNLNAVRAFESAARHESFVQAAAETGVTQSAVSRHIRNLERELGLVLFKRGQRSVSLTPEGRAYAERISEGLAIIAGHGGSDLSPRPRKVVVEVHADLMASWILPLMTPAKLSSLGVELDLRSRLEWPRQLPLDTDLALVWGAHDAPGFRSSPFLAWRGFVVSAPQLQDGRPAPRSIWEAVGYCLLHERRDGYWWRSMLQAARLPAPESFENLYLQHAYLTAEAAVQGLGLAVADDIIFAYALKSGKLVRVAGPELPGSKMFYLLEPSGRRVPPEVLRVRDWLLAEAAAHRKWQASFAQTS